MKGRFEVGRGSNRENKNIYQLCRERAGLTREKASEQMPGLSANRLERIEYGKTLPHSEEIMLMSKAYHNASLCNHFCTHECEIGRKTIPEVSYKHLSQIILEILASLNSANREKDRLIEITADSWIDDDEREDFLAIQKELSEIAQAVDTLSLWIEQRLE